MLWFVTENDTKRDSSHKNETGPSETLCDCPHADQGCRVITNPNFYPPNWQNSLSQTFKLSALDWFEKIYLYPAPKYTKLRIIIKFRIISWTSLSQMNTSWRSYLKKSPCLIPNDHHFCKSKLDIDTVGTDIWKEGKVYLKHFRGSVECVLRIIYFNKTLATVRSLFFWVR